jgi:exopolysaccharide production protein ExoZ
MASTPPPSPTIESLQAGRALAALAVLLLHASDVATAFGGPVPGSGLLAFGYLGVDFFFVLSGFIIYHSTAGRGRSAMDYAKARVRRVYLPYLPIGVGIALLYTLLPQLSTSERQWAWLPTLTLLPVEQLPALTVAWTLQHEVLFYFVFGLLYFNRMLWPGLALWGAAILVNAAFALTTAVPLRLINLEFLFGIAVAVLCARVRPKPAVALLGIVPFGIWIWLGATKEQSVLVGLAIACLILPIISAERQGRLTIPKWLIFLGAASYAIYLIHLVVLSAVVRALPGFSGIPMFLVAATVGLASGVIYYWIVERPLLRLGRPRRDDKSADGPVLRPGGQPSAAVVAEEGLEPPTRGL